MLLYNNVHFSRILITSSHHNQEQIMVCHVSLCLWNFEPSHYLYVKRMVEAPTYMYAHQCIYQHTQYKGYCLLTL